LSLYFLTGNLATSMRSIPWQPLSICKKKSQNHKSKNPFFNCINYFTKKKKNNFFFTNQAEIGSRSNEKRSSRSIQVNSSTNKSRAYKNNEHCANSKTNYSHNQVNTRWNHCEKLG
jgi:hypothetical protein